VNADRFELAASQAGLPKTGEEDLAKKTWRRRPGEEDLVTKTPRVAAGAFGHGVNRRTTV
jgi:hypothetical protein